MKLVPATLVLALVGLTAVALVYGSYTGDDPDLPKPFPETVLLRALVKVEIAQDVIAGRRTLLEAAALFGALNQLPPVPKPIRIEPFPYFPVDSEDEWLCWQVLEHVRVVLQEDPDRAKVAAARLEGEFWEERSRHGEVRLPDPSSLTPIAELLQQARAVKREADRTALDRQR
jgi:hypothetical protein